MSRVFSIVLGVLLVFVVAGFTMPVAFAQSTSNPPSIEAQADLEPQAPPVIQPKNKDEQILARFNATPLPTIVRVDQNNVNEQNLLVEFADIDNNKAFRNFVSWASANYLGGYYDWPTVLPLTVVGDLAPGLSFTGSTLYVDKTLLAWNENWDAQDATTREYRISLIATSGFAPIDEVLKRNGICYITSAEFTIVLELTDLPDQNTNNNGDGDNSGGDDNNGDNGGDGDNNGSDGDNSGGQGNGDNSGDGGSGNSNNGSNQSGNNTTTDSSNQAITLASANAVEPLQNPIPEIIDIQSPVTDQPPEIENKTIYDNQTPLMASPINTGSAFGIANAGMAILSVAAGATALYGMRKKSALGVAASGGVTIAKLSGYLGVAIGMFSVAYLLLTQDIFSAGGAAATNSMTPFFVTIIIVQAACLALQFFSARLDKNANKHPRFKTRI